MVNLQISFFTSNKTIFTGNGGDSIYIKSSLPSTHVHGHAQQVYGASPVHVYYPCTHYDRNIIPKAVNFAHVLCCDCNRAEITNKNRTNIWGDKKFRGEKKKREDLGIIEFRRSTAVKAAPARSNSRRASSHQDPR